MSDESLSSSIHKLFTCHSVSGAAFVIRPIPGCHSWESIQPFITSLQQSNEDLPRSIRKAFEEDRFMLRFLHTRQHIVPCKPVQTALAAWDVTLTEFWLPRSLAESFWHLPALAGLRPLNGIPFPSSSETVPCTAMLDATQTTIRGKPWTLELKPKWATTPWNGSLRLDRNDANDEKEEKRWQSPIVLVQHDRTWLRQQLTESRKPLYSGIDFFSGDLQRVQPSIQSLCMFPALCKLFDSKGICRAAPMVDKDQAKLFSILLAPILIQSSLCSVLKHVQTWGHGPMEMTTDNDEDVCVETQTLPVLPIEIVAPLVQYNQQRTKDRSPIPCYIQSNTSHEQKGLVNVEQIRSNFYQATTARDVSIMATFFTDANCTEHQPLRTSHVSLTVTEVDDSVLDLMKQVAQQLEQRQCDVSLVSSQPSVESVNLPNEFGECWIFVSNVSHLSLWCRLTVVDFDSKTHKTLTSYKEINKEFTKQLRRSGKMEVITTDRDRLTHVLEG